MNDDEPIEMPVDGVLDLHTFRPSEIRPLLDDYIGECLKRSILDLRIIHGKGIGTLRETVHAHLSRCKAVESYHLAGEESGGWGATVVRLRHNG